MRGYFVPLVAGAVLAVSAFLPWVIVSGQSLRGVPDIAALWIVGLGALASVLALLSLITRKNSRHPLFLIGLVAVGIMFLSWRILPRSVGERALIISQASAIVERTPLGEAPQASAGSGIYIGLAAAIAIAGFGLTIVIKRVSTPYAVDSVDDDVE
jgi:hypothetical protein